MVFNLIFHLIWYSAKAIKTLIEGVRSTESDQTRRREQPAATGFNNNSSAADTNTNMKVAVRPHNDTTKLFISFGISFTIIHQLVITVISPATTSVRAKTCVETGENNFFCTDDPKEARKRERKSSKYYLQNFGVAQTIEGSGEENIRMKVLADDMEKYFKKWIVTYDHVESLKEKCMNQHDKCVFWASIGECTKNPGYMQTDCMLACQICEKLLGTPDDIKSEL